MNDEVTDLEGNPKATPVLLSCTTYGKTDSGLTPPFKTKFCQGEFVGNGAYLSEKTGTQYNSEKRMNHVHFLAWKENTMHLMLFLYFKM